MKKMKKSISALLWGTTLATSVILASCTQKSFTFDFEAGEGASQETVSIEEGKDYELPTPSKNGYKFLGWYDNANYEGNPITTVTASKDMKFYAKWGKLYKVNFSDEKINSIEVVSGTKLSDSLKDVSYEKDGLKIKGWVLNGELIDDDYVMPEGDITLTPKYSQAYTIEYYKKEFNSNEYVLDDKMTEEREGFVGEEVKLDEAIPGYNVSNSSTTSITISENKSSNVLKVYLEAATYTLKFNSNYPNDDENTTITKSIKYGQSISFPTDFELDGYQIVGWAKSPNGRIVYENNFVEELVYNKPDDQNIKKYIADDNLELYAVWRKAYTDLDGGADEIYLLSDQSSVIYLKRNGIYFKGEIDSEDDSIFVFKNVEDTILLEGKLLDESEEFVYKSEVKSGTYTEYEKITGEMLDTRILFTEYDQLKLVENGKESNGTYVYSNGIFTATFTDGEYKDKKLYFQVLKLGQQTNAFFRRDESEVQLGAVPVYTVYNNELVSTSYSIVLDGFWTTTFNGAQYIYLYDSEDGTLSLFSDNQSEAYNFKLVDIDGKSVYCIYNSSSDIIISNQDGTILKLDGYYTATLTNNDIVKTGIYELDYTKFGDCIVNVKYEGENTVAKYLVNYSEEDNTYLYTVVDSSYKEIFYVDSNDVYQTPLLVYNDDINATLYGYTMNEKYVKVSSGTYALNPETNNYEYTAVTYYDEGKDAFDNVTDLTKVKSFEYNLTNNDSYILAYWYSYTTEAGKTNLVKKYSFTGDDSSKYVQFVGNKMEYFDGEKLSEVEFQKDDDIVAFMVNEEVKFITYNSDNTTVSFCQNPTTSYRYVANRSDDSEYFNTDKFGNVTYTVVENGKSITYSGVISEKGSKTILEDPIYTFTSSNLTFDFIYLNDGQYFTKYDEKYNGTYTIQNGGLSIFLDGFGYAAKVVVKSTGEEQIYMYYINEEDNQIVLIYSSQQIYIDIADNDKKIVTIPDSTKGTYQVMDNQDVEYLVEFDGYEHAKVYKYGANGNEELVDENATYTTSDTSDTIIKFKIDNESYTLIGNIFYYGNGSQTFTIFVVSYKEMEKIFVNENDWSVINLDAYGNASYVTSTGIYDSGLYRIVSEELFYYMSSTNESYDGLYSYDYEKCSFIKINEVPHAYFTENFDSIIFYENGTVNLNGTEAFYSMAGKNKAIIYLYDKSNSEANNYGYVEKEFGSFTFTKEFDLKEYYQYVGTSLPFSRKEENKDKFPLLNNTDTPDEFGDLNFTPSGAEFNVTGQIKIGHGDNIRSYQCNVVSEKNSDGSYNRYILYSGFKIGFTMEYRMNPNGTSACTYDITDVTFIDELNTGYFVYIVEALYEFTGQDYTDGLQNIYGTVSFITEMNPDGNIKDSYITSDLVCPFLVDSNGNYLNLDKTPYEADEKNGIFTAIVTGSDNKTYKLYMSYYQISKPRELIGINFLATRVDELTTSDGYKLTTEEIVSYDYNGTVGKDDYVGSLYTVKLEKDNELIKLDTVTYINDNLYAIHRDYDENNNVIGTKYYLINITESKVEVEDNGSTTEVAPLYTAVAVTEIDNVQTFASDDKKNLVDILPDNKVGYFIYDGKLVNFDNAVFNSDNNSYVVTEEVENITKTYTISVVDGKLTVNVTTTNNTTDNE